VRRHVHQAVLAELLEDPVHRKQRAERVAVRVLVRREEELVGRAQLRQHLLLLGRDRHSRSRSSEMRIPLSIDSSKTNWSVGVRLSLSSFAIACWSSPWADASPASVSLRADSSPSTL